MATSFVPHCLFFYLFFSLLSPTSSGSIVDFSTSKRVPTLFQTTKNVKTHNMVLFTTSVLNLVPSSTVRVPVFLFLNPFECTKHTNTKLVPTLKTLNISTIVITGTQKSPSQTLSSLKSVHYTLKTLNLNSRVKISVSFPLSTLQTMHQTKNINYERIMQFLKKTDSFLIAETSIKKQSFINVLAFIPNLQIPLILQIKGQQFPSKIEFSKSKLPLSKIQVSGIFFDNETPIFHHTSQRFLIESSKLKSIKHDAYNYDPVPNPTYATPITVPSTNPAPPIVTVSPTNPTFPPGTILPLNPYPTPLTSPSTNPTTPVTNPVTTPATNPVTTYPNNPYPQPSTGTGTTPTPTYLPPISVPSPISVPTPVSVPGTVPVPSTVPVGTVPVSSGQTWCVAKTGTSESALQLALDYACGIGGADCTGIQPMGSCYNPNSIEAHASYAFNSYYQKNPSPTSCDFGGAGMLTNVNPSVGSCTFPSSSLGLGSPTTLTPSTTPTPLYGTGTGTGTGTGFGTGTGTGFGTGIAPGSTTGTGLSPGSAVLNSGSNNSVFGTDSPTNTTSGSVSLSMSWIWFSLLFMFSYIFIRRVV